MTKRLGVPEARQDMGNSSSAAFTLAEVLITLGIIGVVAAMTIPTLISNTKGAEFKTAYKKALSVLNQAAVMNVALADWDFGDLKAKGTDSTGYDDGTVDGTMPKLLKDRVLNAQDITDNYKNSSGTTLFPSKIKVTLKGEDGTNKDEEITITATNMKLYQFSDGTSFAFDSTSTGCKTEANKCVGFIDVNGEKGPNTVVSCDDDKGAASSTYTGDDCVVSSGNITDIYPVFIYGQQIVPATDAARAVLFGKDKAASTTPED